MKVNKKIISNIMSKTLIFIVVLIFVAIFKSVFGNENTTIGVSTVILSLSLLSRDLTKNPIKNFGCLIAFNITLVLGAFIADKTLWLGFIANFIIIGSIAYLFTYELKKPLNMLFGLEYMLIIGSPIDASQLPLRLISVIASACIIMGVHLLCNKNKLVKTSRKMINFIEEKILIKVELIKEKKNTDDINKVINELINQLKITIFESGQEDFKMTKYTHNLIDSLSCIEKINVSLNAIEEKELRKEILNDIYIEFENVKNRKFKSSDIDELLKKYEETEELLILHECLTAFEILDSKIEMFKNIVHDSKELVDIPKGFNAMDTHKKNIKKVSYRVAYAIRLGLLVAITGFLTNLFDFEYGKWMIFTVFALTQPHAEYSYIKSKKRVVGTIIGALIVFISFSLVKEPDLRLVILLIAGYLNSYVSDYRDVAIVVTMCAICADAINVPNANFIIMNRLIFVAIGVIISLIANKFLLRREYKDEEDSLINMQKQLFNKMLEELMKSKDINNNNVGNLFLLPALIENRINVSNLNVNTELLDKNQILINDMYQIYLIGNTKYNKLIKDVKNIIENNKGIDEKLLKLSGYLESRENLREQILLISILNILKAVNNISKQDDKFKDIVLAR